METTMMIDRNEASRNLAKVLAYLNCGKHEDAYDYACRLIEQLRDAGLTELQHRKS
jgi:hypothetical protein